LGKLQLWHQDRYKPYEGVPFEDRTTGDLLLEFYTVVAAEVEQLSSRTTELDPKELERLSELEEMLSADRTSLRGLDAAAADEVCSTAHRTGDPLVDYWEYQVSRGITPDLDLKEPPPRDEW
jgi:hypothetical protein